MVSAAGDTAVAAFDWLTLDADEEVLWADTPHQYSLVPAFALGVPLLFVLVGVPIILSAYLTHTNTHYVVTTAALYKKTGVLSRNVQRIEFDKVQDTSYRQSIFGSQFGYGTVDVSTAGGGGVELRFDNVADPQRLQTLINARIREREGGAGSGRDKTAVLDDIVTELRAIRRAVEGDVGNDGDDRDDTASDDAGAVHTAADERTSAGEDTTETHSNHAETDTPSDSTATDTPER